MRLKKKIIITVTIVLVIVIGLAGCSNDKPVGGNQATISPSATSANPGTTPPQGITVNKIDFKEVDPGVLEQEKYNKINSFALVGGYFYWVDTDGVYTMFIGLGEKPTGGYSIRVLSVEDNEGKTNIIVEEIIPKPDEIVTQALTYPYVVIEMKGITDRFIIKNTNNDEYKQIKEDELDVYIIDGVYQGQIDSNSIEVKVEDSFMVFRNPEMSSLLSGLKKDDPVKIAYKISSESQLILESINPAIVDDEILEITGIYQGQIDNNSIEVKINDSFMVFRNSEITKYIADYKKDDSVKITYTTSAEGQFLLLSMEPGSH